MASSVLNIQTALKAAIVVLSLVFIWPHPCKSEYNLPNRTVMTNCAVLDESISLNLNRRIQREHNMNVIVWSVVLSFVAYTLLTILKLHNNPADAAYYQKMIVLGVILHANQLSLATTNHASTGHGVLAAWHLLLCMFFVSTVLINTNAQRKQFPVSVFQLSALHWLFTAAIVAIIVAGFVKYHHTGTTTSYVSMVEHVLICFFFASIAVY